MRLCMGIIWEAPDPLQPERKMRGGYDLMPGSEIVERDVPLELRRMPMGAQYERMEIWRGDQLILQVHFTNDMVFAEPRLNFAEDWPLRAVTDRGA